MLILKQISGAVCLLNSYSKFTLSNAKKPLTNQGFLLIIKSLYEKTMTKTVEYTGTAKRVRDGASLMQVAYI